LARAEQSTHAAHATLVLSLVHSCSSTISRYQTHRGGAGRGARRGRRRRSRRGGRWRGLRSRHTQYMRLWCLVWCIHVHPLSQGTTPTVGARVGARVGAGVGAPVGAGDGAGCKDKWRGQRCEHQAQAPVIDLAYAIQCCPGNHTHRGRRRRGARRGGGRRSRRGGRWRGLRSRHTQYMRLRCSDLIGSWLSPISRYHTHRGRAGRGARRGRRRCSGRGGRRRPLRGTDRREHKGTQAQDATRGLSRCLCSGDHGTTLSTHVLRRGGWRCMGT
jgi:hypothetical protein